MPAPVGAGRPAVRALAALCIANASEAVEVLSAGYILECTTASRSLQTLIAAVVYVGMLLGGLVSGVLADHYGRKPTLQWAMLLAAAAALAAALAPALWVLVLARLLAGAGVGAATPPLFTLASELLPHRSGQAIATVASFWMVGSVYTAALALAIIGHRPPPSLAFTAEWRRFALACAGLPLLACALVCQCVYEPKRPKHPLLPEPCADESEQAAPEANRLTAPSPQNSPTPSDGPPPAPPHPLRAVLTRLCTRTNLKPLAPLLLAWGSLNFGYYGMATWITVLLSDAGVEDAYLVALLYACANLPGNLASILLVDRIGRRPLLGLSMLLAAMAALAAASQIHSPQPAYVIAAAVAFNAFATAGWNALDALSAESFENEVRASAFGLLAAAGRLASIGAQIVNGSLADSPPLLLTVTSALMAIGCTSVCCMPPPS